jgi:hypothetical protein
LRRDFAPANRQRAIDEADLDEHGRLVEVDVLVRDLVAFELYDGHHWDLQAFASRQDAGQQQVHRIECVKRRISSSTIRSCPMVRERENCPPIQRPDRV